MHLVRPFLYGASVKKSKSKLLELAAALEADFSSNDDKQIKHVSVCAADGTYNFQFEAEKFPVPDGIYDIDIDLIGAVKKQVIVLSKGETGFSFQVMSKGVHFQDQPIDCSFDGLNE